MNPISIFGMLLSTSLLAQDAATNTAAPIETPAAAAIITNSAPAAPESPTNSPSVKKKSAGKKRTPKKSTAKKNTSAELRTVPLVAGPAVVDANHVNVRGQARLNSEVVTRLARNQKVTVMEEITRNNSGPDEPSAWAKIVLPADVHVWVNTGFIDPSSKAVKPKKLNVRGGPGENYSVLGRMEMGEVVTQVSAKGDWLEIEAPTNTYAFVAAQYLKQEPAAAATTPVEPLATSATVTNEPTVAIASGEAPNNGAAVDLNTNNIAATTEPLASAGTNSAPAHSDEPPPKRVVQREGIVRGTTSIQAPTHFELISPENRNTLDYLYTASPSLDLRRYKGLRIIVTGEEGLEDRWGNTPVITIEKIQVVE
jgi:uncharacterized protein YgiM (DUF1202 family)